MVVCKFYLQGNCSWGSACKFDHLTSSNDGEAAGGQRTHGQSILRQSNSSNTPVDTNTLVNAVQNDMMSTEKGNQWILSCYAPFKEKAMFPGFEDRSTEEVRFGFYEAQLTNTMEQYKLQLRQMMDETVHKIRSLQHPTQDMINIVTQIYNTSSSIPQPTEQSSVFGGGQQQQVSHFKSPSVFGGSTSIFGAPTQQSNTVFGGMQPPQVNPANSVFGGQQQMNSTVGSVFGGGNAFGVQQQQQPQQVAASSNVFGGQQLNNTASIFGGQQQLVKPTGSVFGGGQQQIASVFGGMQAQPTASTVFSGQQAPSNSVFGVQQPQIIPNNSVFGGPQAQVIPTNSVFGGQQAQIIPNTSVFGGQQAQVIPNTSVFGGPQAQVIPTNSVFSGQQAQVIPNSSVFGGSQPTSAVNALAGMSGQQHSASIFGNAQPTASNVKGDMSMYSQIESLSAESLEAFQQPVFHLGLIPDQPPPYQLCT